MATTQPALQSLLDRRPVLVVLAGPNGAGKTTFYEAHLKSVGLRFLNADAVARELELDAYEAARVLTAIRDEFVEMGESFMLETVFSDPVGDKLEFLQRAVARGYSVVLCFIGLSSAARSIERVAMRVSQGGHDVPDAKLKTRYPRTLANLRRAIRELPVVLVFDNTDLGHPFKQVAVFCQGELVDSSRPLPRWVRSAMT